MQNACVWARGILPRFVVPLRFRAAAAAVAGDGDLRAAAAAGACDRDTRAAVGRCAADGARRQGRKIALPPRDDAHPIVPVARQRALAARDRRLHVRRPWRAALHIRPPPDDAQLPAQLRHVSQRGARPLPVPDGRQLEYADARADG
eukprot:1466523-Prymnesium_polylepis.1